MAERQLYCLTDDTFRPIILRKGTVVGWSPRMRYDLVTNAMIKTALVEGRIVVHNPNLWRPLIDVEDASDAYARALEADHEITGIFNISTRNITLEELGTIVAAGLRDVGLDVAIHTENRTDVRSYRVVTDKATRVLKFDPKKPMSDTVSEVIKKAMAQPVADLEQTRYYNVRQMQQLIAEGSLYGHSRSSNGHAAESRQAVVASIAE
jgi:nucleoside-diphosphate-sugar epimerase